MNAKPVVVALMLGRGGSSMANKNGRPVLGVPLLLWPARAARQSRHISRFYVSSDDDAILSTAASAGYAAIRRPAPLAADTAQGCDAIRHAFEIIEQDGPVDIVVMQHANVGTISTEMINACIEKLVANPLATAVIPAHEKPEYHPLHSKTADDDGFLRLFFPYEGKMSSNRQDLPRAFFYDHSFWVLRGRQAIFDPQGEMPWPCMGSRVLPLENSWGCIDVHNEDDLALTEKWLRHQGFDGPVAKDP